MTQPETLWAMPEYFNFATDVVDKWAEKTPALRAMLWTNDNGAPARGLSYRYFSEQSQKAARLLTNLGIKRGDRLMIMLNRVPAWWEIGTAAIRAGIVLCPCTTLATAKDIEFRAQTSGATSFVGNRETIAKLLQVKDTCDSIRVIVQADGDPLPDVVQYRDEIQSVQVSPFRGPKTKSTDPAMIYFTSGTTGLPKMVLHNEVSYPLGHILTGKHWLLLKEGKTFWTLAEQGWAKAGWSWFATWNLGATLFIEDSNQPFSAQTMLDTLHKYDIHTLCAPPTAYRQLVTKEMQNYFSSHPPKALEHCVSAGEPLNGEAINTWAAMSGLEIKDAYGQTETIMIAGNFAGAPVKRGSMGKPTPGVPLHVINEKGQIAPDMEEGDLAVKYTDENGKKTPCLYDGYISKEGVITRKTKPSVNSAGRVDGEWHMTGDRAYRDHDGYLWFVGRSDDVINSSGYRIGPFEVESTLKQHPAVVESAVVASPDPDRGEVVKAFIVLNNEYSKRKADRAALVKDIQDFCKRVAAPYKYPRKIEFVEADALPKTVSGKIKRAELRQRERKMALSASGGQAKL